MCESLCVCVVFFVFWVDICYTFMHEDVNECTARGILVGYTPEVLNETMAELVLMLMLFASRRITEAQQAAQKYATASGFVY